MTSTKAAAAARLASGVHPRRYSKFRFTFSLDHVLAGAGVMAALCSLGFAVYVISDRNWQPYFAGEEYLGIFAKPRRLLETAARPSPILAHASEQVEPISIDLTPTGSIPAAQRPNVTERAKGPLSLRLLSATPEHAWIGDGTSFRLVRVGDVLPNLGRITDISQSDGQWAVQTDSGASIERGDFNQSTQQETRPEQRFARSMIFEGSDK